MSYHFDGPLPEAEFNQKFAAAMAAAAQVDGVDLAKATTPDQFVRAFNGANTDPEAVEEHKFDVALTAWDAFDEMVGPGGSAEKLSRFEKLELEAKTYRAVGPRPELPTAAEIVEAEREHKIAESARLRADAEALGAQAAFDMGFSNTDEARAAWARGERIAPVPSLLTNQQGVRQYHLPDGKIVSEYIASAIPGDPNIYRNHEFDNVAAHVERMNSRR